MSPDRRAEEAVGTGGGSGRTARDVALSTARHGASQQRGQVRPCRRRFARSEPVGSAVGDGTLPTMQPVLALLLLVLASCGATSAPAPEPGLEPLRRAHAHNDYQHDRPLEDAADLGFTSVEVDVFPGEGRLLVAHHALELIFRRTFEDLYLEPLVTRLESSGTVLGHPLADQGGFLLLVDAKDDGEAVLALLEEKLSPHRRWLTRWVDGQLVPGELTVLLSGARPTEALRTRRERLVHLDGRPGEIGRLDAALAPMVSTSWRSSFRWRGKGEQPEEERRELEELVARAHAGGHRLRFWALPHDERVWEAVYAAGVDLLQSDDLERLARFLRSRAGVEGEQSP